MLVESVLTNERCEPLATRPAVWPVPWSVHIVADPPARAAVYRSGCPTDPVTIELSGLWCTYTVEQVGHRVRAAAATAGPVALDLGAVEFLDGRGIGLLLTMLDDATRRGVACRLTRCSAAANRLLRLLEIDHRLLA